MRFTKSGGQTAVGPDPWFTATVYIDSIRNPDDQSYVGCAHVRFTPGARTAWHTHPKGQTLHVTDGIECVGRQRSEVHEIVPVMSSTSSPTRSTGTARHPTASWPRFIEPGWGEPG
jgi:hypothetical protein